MCRRLGFLPRIASYGVIPVSFEMCVRFHTNAAWPARPAPQLQRRAGVLHHGALVVLERAHRALGGPVQLLVRAGVQRSSFPCLEQNAFSVWLMNSVPPSAYRRLTVQPNCVSAWRTRSAT